MCVKSFIISGLLLFVGLLVLADGRIGPDVNSGRFFFWSTSSRVLLSSEPHSSRPSFSALMLFVHFGQMELAFYLVFGHRTRLCRRSTEREAGGRWTSFARRPGCCVDPFFHGLWSIHRTVPFFCVSVPCPFRSCCLLSLPCIDPFSERLNGAVCARAVVLAAAPPRLVAGHSRPLLDGVSRVIRTTIRWTDGPWRLNCAPPTKATAAGSSNMTQKEGTELNGAPGRPR